MLSPARWWRQRLVIVCVSSQRSSAPQETNRGGGSGGIRRSTARATRRQGRPGRRSASARRYRSRPPGSGSSRRYWCRPRRSRARQRPPPPTRRSSPRGALRIARVVGLPDPRVDRAIGELEQAGLADDHGARFAQALDHRGVRSGTSWKIGSEPNLVGTPAIAIRSLIATKTPCSVPRSRPEWNSTSALAARSSAVSLRTERKAFSSGSRAPDPLEAEARYLGGPEGAVPIARAEGGDAGEGDRRISHRPTSGPRIPGRPAVVEIERGEPAIGLDQT